MAATVGFCAEAVNPAFHRRTLTRSITALLLGGLLSGCSPSPSSSEDTGPPKESHASPVSYGEGFDFYVLALSWSPSFCLVDATPGHPQCRDEVAFGFLVHGLWPQFEQGYPEFCESDEPRFVPDQIADSVADIMPSRGLVGHQWRKHGTCSGLDQVKYLEATRAARQRILVPDAFQTPSTARSIDAVEIEDAFARANQGLVEEGIAVSCNDGLLREVRICLTPSLEFRDCPEVDRRGCRQRGLELPAIR